MDCKVDVTTQLCFFVLLLLNHLSSIVTDVLSSYSMVLDCCHLPQTLLFLLYLRSCCTILISTCYLLEFVIFTDYLILSDI